MADSQVGDMFVREYVGTFELASTYMDPNGKVAVIDAQGNLLLVPLEGLKPVR